MENQLLDCNTAPDAVSSGEAAVGWIAPLQTMKIFSIAEFTRVDSFPGDDGLGVFTQS